MALTQEEFDAFEKLVSDTSHQEIACRPYLEHATQLLIQRTLQRVNSFIEIRSFAGDADLAIAVEIINDNGEAETWAYFWELKAPQCYLFEYDDNKNRCRPTADLVKAENQLLHYVDEAVANQNTRVRLGVMDSKNIRPGGIIIGTKERMLRSPANPMDLKKAATALQLRREQFYQAQQIRVLTWDHVLDQLRPQTILQP